MLDVILKILFKKLSIIFCLTLLGVTSCSKDVEFRSNKIASLDSPPVIDDYVPENGNNDYIPEVPPNPVIDAPNPDPVVIDDPVDPPPVVVTPPPVEEPNPPVDVPEPPIVVVPPTLPTLPPIVVTPPTLPPIPPIVINPPAPPVIPPTFEEVPVTCSSGNYLTSCMSCPNQNNDGSVKLGSKAQNLLEIMDRACRVHNKSQPKNYQAPSRQELAHRLRACSPQIYPDTVFTKEELKVIPKLVNGDSALLNKMFGKFWYTADLSDAFDHYFGLGVEEAVPLLCYKTMEKLEGDLMSREMWDWYEQDFIFNWPKDLQDLHAYYQNIRSGLKKCLDKEGTGGPNSASQSGQSNSCVAKKFQGNNFQKLKEIASKYISEGYTVSVDNGRSCATINDINQFNWLDENLSIAVIKCEN